MSKTISFTISDEQYEVIRHEGMAKGLKPSEYSRMAVFSHIGKYPTKGVMALLDKLVQKREPTA